MLSWLCGSLDLEVRRRIYFSEQGTSWFSFFLNRYPSQSRADSRNQRLKLSFVRITAISKYQEALRGLSAESKASLDQTSATGV